MAQHEALAVAQRLLLPLPHCYKVGVDPKERTILVRFYFPDLASQRYGALFQQLEAETGWQVVLHQQVHQGALIALAQSLVPEGVVCLGTPSIHHERREVHINRSGNISEEYIKEAQEQFHEQCGWILRI